MRTLIARTGARLPVVGLAKVGTWTLGEDRRNRKAEADALRLGPDLGMTLVDRGVITISKSTNPEHIRANTKLADFRLTEEDLREFDEDLPAAFRASPAGNMTYPVVFVDALRGAG